MEKEALETVEIGIGLQPNGALLHYLKGKILMGLERNK